MKRQLLVQKIETLGKQVFNIKDLEKLFPDEIHLKIFVKRLMDAGVLIQITRGIYALNQTQLDIEKNCHPTLLSQLYQL